MLEDLLADYRKDLGETEVITEISSNVDLTQAIVNAPGESETSVSIIRDEQPMYPHLYATWN